LVAIIALIPPRYFALVLSPARNLIFTVVATALTCAAAAWHTRRETRKKPVIAWACVTLACCLNPQVLDLLRGHISAVGIDRRQQFSEIVELGKWANQNTWGSSMFLFPDEGKQNNPGVFRAVSRRASWVDWEAGKIVQFSPQAGLTWEDRWNSTMRKEYSARRLQDFLSLPVDYYVLHFAHELNGIRPVFKNDRYVVYDAQDLRNASKLQTKRSD
jgi:hypothetical protein